MVFMALVAFIGDFIDFLPFMSLGDFIADFTSTVAFMAISICRVGRVQIEGARARGKLVFLLVGGIGRESC